jgi:hypothetical protein
MGKTLSDSFPDPEKLDLLMNAGQDLLLHDLAVKKEFRSEAAMELQTGEGAFTFSECLSALIQAGAGELVMSSLETLGPLLSDMALEYRSLCDFLDPQFVFSENIDQFVEEFTALLALFFYAHNISNFPEDDIPKFDLAIMKASRQSGKIIAQLKSDGKKTSDWGKKTGSAKYKGYVSYEEVILVAKEVSKRLKTKRDIARAVRKQLVKNETGKANPRKVFKTDHIRKNILKKTWSEIL